MLNYSVYRHPKNVAWVTFVHGAGGSSSIWFKQVREFRKHFNVLLLDLRGHGNSKPVLKDAFNSKYTFDSITEDIVEVIDKEKIEKSHFVGISLGTILIRNLAEKHPGRVSSMIMGGAIMKLNFRSQVLMKLGVVFKSVIPYMFLYKFFAFIIMPKKNHKKSRLLFANEAKKLYQKEFVRWFRLTSEINPLLRFFRAKDIKIPTLYVMGEEDYLFLPSVQKVVLAHQLSHLFVIKNSGHVVNVEQPEVFNKETISFIEQC
ncbi:alpha/beta hydrolase [Aquimarina sp. AD10]|uniref:2-succinyl-6-hydroxy-2, 4-cyclohexadiene-1-carboxylate synthase n=1 Tax=Aquimarina aggregata TaxID=1642818 RepID=A0A163ABN0_9FLAO|nr:MULTISPECIES: alpha/beta hydrolase [Aquimarina]AXT63249.1 alpha/beta hydrolase [Aquimarina sp. AD10]KZS40421.1 2-succinyl-6-hydroxy-2,4-cyclohexadiene-1-carboxylate synthase [Aquimarina aggregata]RKN00738.1 alpha/beta hydrolase [Aquimarina sp. AD10]